ncbi:unnamed protein product [Hermetia illucens]|uniref:Ig-like domain-containing protein n=1 Tax=Hermetia illucens TaxID=343691 RepID=A0A7R8YRW7_HERIL|nr:unnamed protein product [Hermetia illucens]
MTRSKYSGLNRLSLISGMFQKIRRGTLTYAQIDVDPKQVTLTEGEKTSLLCRSGNKINYCRFIVPGASQVLVLSETWPSKTPGYSYFGQGLAAGQCGVTIDRVIPQNHGQAKCFLGIEGDEIEGQIELTVALPPHRPELEVISKPPRNFFEADETLQARCISRDGRPAANISWFLNDEPILEGLGVPETAETTAADGTSKLFTSVQEIKRRLQPSDDGKFLVCRTSHIADRGQENMVKQQLLVKYLPLPQQEITVYGVTLTRTALINVTIQANPRPRVEWTVSGVVIPQGTQNGRYEAYEPAELGNGEYNVVLSIDSLTLEDTTKDYMLRASNELGQQEYIVRISSSNTPASSGLDIGAIIGIVVAVAVLLIIVVLIVFARATGRWCFGGASLNTDIGPDSEAQINPHLNDEFDGKEVYDPEQHIDTTQQSGDETPPVKDKLEQPIKTELKKAAANGHHNGKDLKTNTPV